MNGRFVEMTRRFEHLGRGLNQRFDPVNRELAQHRERIAKFEDALDGCLAGPHDHDAA